MSMLGGTHPVNVPIMSAAKQESWVMRHPSTVVTLVVFLLAFVQWAGSRWIREQDAPQWQRVNNSIRAISTYQLEQDRYNSDVLKAIAEGAGIRLPARPLDLDRASLRVRDDREIPR